MSLKALLAIIFVFVGCCSNVVFLELLIKEEPGSGSIITFSQFIFIAIHGFIFTSKFGTKKNVIPIWEYSILVILFFIVNLTNNIAFDFKISMPLHIIFRSCGLITSMIMSIIYLKRDYTVMKYLSVMMITIGTIICTFASADDVHNSDIDDGSQSSDFLTWIKGILILTFALFLSARMGIFQECLYAKYGKHPMEALFYIHLMSLPGFLFTSRSIYESGMKFNLSSSLETDFPSISLLPFVPKMWIYLLGNTLTQYICISSVFTLTSECSALTVTLVLTLRKFLSLLFSIFYFQNPFTFLHWVGTVLVFGGTLLFSNIFSPQFESWKQKSS